MALRDNPITPCRLREETKELVDRYVEELKAAAPRIGTHGLGEEEFWASGLFRAAVESIRGTQIASMEAKKQYLASLFNAMQAAGHIAGWTFEGSGERHDYHVRMRDGSLTVIEAKGCLDGNNTNIFTRPANADQFIIWSLCQNIGDPRKNVWSGIHTRLLPEMITRKEQVDGLVVLDMVCGTIGRVCPKIAERPECGRVIEGKRVTPPCLYMFPRSIPDPRNNAKPPVHTLKQVPFIEGLLAFLRGGTADVTNVNVEVRMSGPNVERQTTLTRAGVQVCQSEWVQIKRART